VQIPGQRKRRAGRLRECHLVNIVHDFWAARSSNRLEDEAPQRHVKADEFAPIRDSGSQSSQIGDKCLKPLSSEALSWSPLSRHHSPPSLPPNAFSTLQRFAALPAALSFRFGFFGAVGAEDSRFMPAHLFRCASAIALRAAALIRRLLRPVDCDAVVVMVFAGFTQTAGSRAEVRAGARLQGIDAAGRPGVSEGCRTGATVTVVRVRGLVPVIVNVTVTPGTGVPLCVVTVATKLADAY
jgi:hypothetical protein